MIVRIPLAWSNAYLLKSGNEAALIDTGLQKDRPRLLAALQKQGVRPEQIRAVYLTHGHCDHAGNAAFFARLGSTIHAHVKERRFLEPPLRTYVPRGLKALIRPLTTLCFAFGERFFPVERGPVHRKLKEGDCLDAPGGALRVIHCPGHTPGQVAYFREHDGILFSGDAILHIVPFKLTTDLSLSIPFLSSDWPQTVASACSLAQWPVSCLYSGHGVPLTDETSARLRSWAASLR